MPGVQAKSYNKKAHIKQLQLEQDSGKSLHDTEASRFVFQQAEKTLFLLIIGIGL